MRYLDELKKLNLPLKKFAIFGSGPLGIRNLKIINDIDIIVKADLWEELKSKYPPQNIKSIKIGNVEVYKDWLPWVKDVDELIDDAEIIEGFPFVKLKYVLDWKRQMNREKDIKDIAIINRYLKSSTKE